MRADTRNEYIKNSAVFSVRVLCAVLLKGYCEDPLSPMVNCSYNVIPERNVSLEEIERFFSPERELCNFTVSKIVLKGNYCGGCYYV